ncbi:TPA: hypothetical protein DDW35_10790 [Candidatus Sumerlaeota bacterium]|nr:hypothetical protein [Candidatus Sumerlaeota bacterium]
MTHLVFMYHGLDPHDGRYDALSDAEKSYVLSRETFAAHLDALEQAGRHCMGADEVWGKEAVGETLLTFDDGWKSDYDVAFPLLRAKGVSAIFFITTDWVGTPGYVTWEQLREMADAGMGIGSHGKTHRFLSTLTPLEQRLELADSRKVLEEKLGREIRALSLPGGRSNADTLATARDCGYKTVFTSSPGLPVALGGLWMVGRIAMRPNWTAEKMRVFLDDPQRTLRRMYATALVKRLAEKTLGAKRYDAVHRIFWRWKKR